MEDVWESYRHFNVRVGINCQQIEEFEIGSSIEFDDKYAGVSGRGTIISFAQNGYEPTVWYKDSVTGELKNVMLGWCVLANK